MIRGADYGGWGIAGGELGGAEERDGEQSGYLLVRPPPQLTPPHIFPLTTRNSVSIRTLYNIVYIKQTTVAQGALRFVQPPNSARE